MKSSDKTESLSAYRESVPPELRPSVVWVFPEWGNVTAPEAATHIIGRTPACNTTLNSSKVSREHAEICRVGDTLVIRDLGSHNGTAINGHSIGTEAMVIRSGDVIRLGDWIGCVVSGVTETVRFEEIGSGLWGGPTLATAVSSARSAAERGLPLVIEGATGTGKERLACAIHAWSKRSGEYVGVNCAAIPSDLAEAELFGHSKGAFTGADRARPGYFRQADNGTLLLDEFLDLPALLQTKLLRVLEEWEVKPLGETKPIKIDVLLLAATQQTLSDVVDTGRLRNDLVARLGVLTIRLPNLRERKEDILPLFRRFAKDELGDQVPPLDMELAEWLCLHDYPQNVRELEWFTRMLCALHSDKARWGIPELPAQYRARRTSAAAAPRTDADEELFHRLVKALDQHNGVLMYAAQAIGISRTKAYRILEAHPEFRLNVLRDKR